MPTYNSKNEKTKSSWCYPCKQTWVAMPAWSVPGTHKVGRPFMRAYLTIISWCSKRKIGQVTIVIDKATCWYLISGCSNLVENFPVIQIAQEVVHKCEIYQKCQYWYVNRIDIGTAKKKNAHTHTHTKLPNLECNKHSVPHVQGSSNIRWWHRNHKRLASPIKIGLKIPFWIPPDTKEGINNDA